MARVQKRQEARQLNVRVPVDVYEALRTYAYATDSTINEAATRALVDYLSTKGRQKQVEAFLGRARDDWRAALDKLSDL